MQNLEASLNCKLFDRMGRTILPTTEAELLYSRAVDILADIQKLEDDIRATRKAVEGELLIGASTIPGTYILPEIAASFKQDYPAISFEITIDDSEKIIDAVAKNHLYLGFVGANIPMANLHYHEFRTDNLILAASAESQVSPDITLDELCKLPFIIREKGSGTRKNTELLLNQHNLSIKHLNVSATLGSSAAVKESIKANLGVSIISRYAMQEELLNGKVKQVNVKGINLTRFFYLVTPKNRTFPNHYQAFIDAVTSAHVVDEKHAG